ncbi:hypothetical protein Kpol_1064p52 [Vanderwaltozyma polyspora DSM 70294]|uniref:Thioredoxin domain-containing protein n=1 Tax=Vanderwaltozyma polyspora (strain ATCC 22028 / DSM 70294 / BCRC 21397 / CBS 2163 / NBRC 10782 / NRRL Y-8283 / UCD 57-17) TaxID=436907 RepID=A7TMH6_VANPO|nr:uncharacterized protein Kpol_1064p52 [Vanderwaltozyma polyspora DSM 70294]EDO16570.1 hypothetical protein Kpol_1064p52 [Vanderwaltozyma polyspora DSM 70294]
MLLLLSLQKVLLLWLAGNLIGYVSGSQPSFYTTDTHIMELDSSNFDSVVHNTNYTTLVEFYAPWCGYCQQLKGIMHKVGKKLDGLVQVAAVNCDLGKNKQICGSYKIEGFPTLLVFKPPKIDLTKNPKDRLNFDYHANEMYRGERKLAPIIDFCLSRVKNYVKKISSIKSLQSYLQNGTSPIHGVLFSKKNLVSPTQKSIALDWLGKINFSTIPNDKLKESVIDSKLSKTNPNIAAYLQELIPTQKNNNKSMFVLFDIENDKYYVHEGEDMSKIGISQFIIDTINVKPSEGPLSKRFKYLESVKTNKKRSKKNKKAGKRKNHDEL